MSYRIIYLPERKKRRVWPWVLSLAIVCVVCVSLFPQGRQAIETALIPGEPEVTYRAFGELLAALREGTALPQALQAFCRSLAAGLG